MHIRDILKSKGQAVSAVAPQDTMETAAALMRLDRVGAVVVRGTDGALLGLLSEGDIVRALADCGPRMHALPVSDFMQTRPLTCAPGDTVARVAQQMTLHRARHVPVLDDGALAGIVSVGDVVKQRLEEMTLERDTLRDIALSNRMAG